MPFSAICLRPITSQVTVECSSAIAWARPAR